MPPILGSEARREALLFLGLLVAVAFVGWPSLGEGPASGPDSALSDAVFRLNARYLLGSKTMFAGLGPGQATDFGTQAIPQLEAQVQTPDQRIALAVIAAELVGTDQALERLASLNCDQSSPELVADIELLELIYGEETSPITAAQSAGLVARHGWFAELALSHKLPPDDPQRQGLITKATMVALAFAALFLCGLLLTAAGFVLFLVALVLRARARLQPAYPKFAQTASAQRTPYLETVFLVVGWMVVMALLRTVLGNPEGPVAVLLGAIGLLTTLLILAWPRWRGQTRADLAVAVGWHRGRGVWREIGSGLIGYIAGIPILVLGLIAALVVARFIPGTPHHPVVDWIRAGGSGLFLTYLLACVWAPLVEETVFRGYFYHYLRGRTGVFLSTLTVSLVFAAIHPQGLIALPALAAIATVLALIREWRGSLIASVAVHATHNAVMVTLLLLILL